MYDPEIDCDKIIFTLKYLSEQKQLSQNALAKKAGISASTLHSLFLGETRPYLYTLLKLCNALEVSVEDVLGDRCLSISEEEKCILFTYRNLSDNKKKQLFIFLNILINFKEDL